MFYKFCQTILKNCKFCAICEILPKSRPYPLLISPPIFKNRRRRVLSPCEKIAKNTEKSKKSGNRSFSQKVHLGRCRTFRLLFWCKMRNVTQLVGYSDETRVGIFGADPTALAFFVMWRPFHWLFGHVENFSTRPIALASFVTRRKKRGLSGHIEKFLTQRIHLALFVAWQKVRGVSVHFENFASIANLITNTEWILNEPSPNGDSDRILRQNTPT